MAAAATLASAACPAEAPPPSEPVPEPTEALRPAAASGKVPASARVVDYEIDARYDEEEHRVEGRAHITWRNNGPAPVHEIPFHLYMNGFRAEDTAWMRQGRGSHRAHGQSEDNPWGYIDIETVERLQGIGSDGNPARTPLTHREADEPSLMTVSLDTPVDPGQAVEFEIAFVTQFPEVFARTGFSGRFVMAGQWFPKPGVLHADGSWRAHPFTLYSEFYADFGHYEVHLDLPADLVAGASGILVSSTTEGSRQLLHYRAEMVHDFAWTAGPDLFEAWDDYEGIRIRALVPEERAADASAHLAAQRAALESMEARFGPYPWSTITLIDPPEGAGGAGGMEYPTFYTTSAPYHLPPTLRALGFDHRVGGEFTTIHEFGHQYFQGLLASDEFSQPWLDEGLNTFSNMLVYVDWHGPDDAHGPWLARFAGHELGLYDGLRLDMKPGGPLQPVDQPANRFTPLVGQYGSLTYRKTAAIMLTLRRVLGAEAFDHTMRRYADEFRFRHPRGADLEGTFVRELGEHVVLGRTDDDQPITLSIPEYFEQALRSTKTVDFRVHKVTNRPAQGDAGWHRDEHGALVGGDPPERTEEDSRSDEQLEAVVVVHRAGEMIIPVEVEVEFDDGSTARVLWDGRGRYRVLRWPGRRVRSASIDPEGRLVLEGRRWNNTRFAHERHPEQTVSQTLGTLSEASSLALMGGLGP